MKKIHQKTISFSFTFIDSFIEACSHEACLGPPDRPHLGLVTSAKEGMDCTVRQEAVPVVVSSQGSPGQGEGQLSTRVSSNPGGRGTRGEGVGSNQTCYGVSI